jgi:hypothetical protein
MAIFVRHSCKEHIKRAQMYFRYSYKGHTKEDAAHVVGQNQIRTKILGHCVEDKIDEDLWGVYWAKTASVGLMRDTS